ncbi:glycosyl hydrolase 115 family protein [Cesiribacter sp. SM1]|uniref:glycosyl hydrolase 115 family protein n=1 Tax=Cesiribacter sp. SM1 TaxID=2861196 RepID=UPI001CD62E95|nr:glycosyl hydrolase 115 family protein [Cesiribacter sp. SM1]
MLFPAARSAAAICLFFLLLMAQSVSAVEDTLYVSSQEQAGSFTLAAAGKTAALYISPEDHAGVIRALRDLQSDINRVTGAQPQLYTNNKPGKAKELVLVGTLGKSPLIDGLVKNKKLNVDGIAGKWETFVVQVVEKPMKGVDRALVIAGSDKRGTIFGIYDLSAQIGVSPWHYFADVPVKQQQNLYVLPGRHTDGEPKIKYRGIFINDEAPALAGWAQEQFGGFNHKFYVHVFELILRMKGNFLWPAMWGRAFYDDDPKNPVLADEYGVVISTSHHEPMMRAHDEWRRYGSGPWNYKNNPEKLQEFWREGIKRMGTNESIVTLGMRGDGDEAMSEGTEISLLEKIVDDQRKIISEVTGKKAEETPQVWALYKEVQDYYDKGMRVPDDVTLLLADDNWGNIRKLPKAGEKQHSGGYGIYYHYDYVGGPRNYKWINTNPIARVWEQMHLAYEYGADRLWLVNVGDIKPMEFPTEFFLDYAWNPEKWPAERLQEYTQLWAKEQFGEKYATEIAELLTQYARFNGRRKPELLSADTYSLTSYREAERVVEEYNALAAKAEAINEALPAKYKDAYYQLVLYPVAASANINELWVTVGKNRLYARQGRVAANDLAKKAQALFDKDKALAEHYHKGIAGGKWNHMMSQTHISYTYWQQPEKDVLPEVKEVTPAAGAEMGVMVEGSDEWWPAAQTEAVLPEITPFSQQAPYLEIFNRGQEPFQYQVQSAAPWLKVSEPAGTVDKEQRLTLDVDWNQAPNGIQRVPLTITGPNGSKVVVQAVVHKPNLTADQVQGFVESNGYVSMEAEHFSRAVEAGPVKWKVIPDLGKTLSGVTPVPVTAPDQTPGGNSPHLQYKMHLFNSGEINVRVLVSPTLNFHNDQGLRFAISIDDERPQILNLHADQSEGAWNRDVANNIKELVSKHNIKQAGEHVLKFWMVDPGVVLQKIVVETREGKPSYLGPPESYNKSAKIVE